MLKLVDDATVTHVIVFIKVSGYIPDCSAPPVGKQCPKLWVKNT